MAAATRELLCGQCCVLGHLQELRQGESAVGYSAHEVVALHDGCTTPLVDMCLEGMCEQTKLDANWLALSPCPPNGAVACKLRRALARNDKIHVST